MIPIIYNMPVYLTFMLNITSSCVFMPNCQTSNWCFKERLSSVMQNILKNNEFQCRVSSVLNKDVTQYGKSLMFDGKEDTCWCSENESPQWIVVQWKSPMIISSFHIQFQGGFVGSECEIILVGEDGTKLIEPFYPEDNNSVQKFNLKSPCIAKQITVKFNSSTDFFGRIIIYKLEMFS